MIGYYVQGKNALAAPAPSHLLHTSGDSCVEVGLSKKWACPIVDNQSKWGRPIVDTWRQLVVGRAAIATACQRKLASIDMASTAASMRCRASPIRACSRVTALASPTRIASNKPGSGCPSYIE